MGCLHLLPAALTPVRLSVSRSRRRSQVAARGRAFLIDGLCKLVCGSFHLVWCSLLVYSSAHLLRQATSSCRPRPEGSHAVAVSQPATEVMGAQQSKPGQQRAADMWRGDSAEKFVNSAAGNPAKRQPAQGICEARMATDSAGSVEQRKQQASGQEAEAFKPPPLPH